MKLPKKRPGSPLDAIYRRTDLTPDQIFQTLGRLRHDAARQVENLIDLIDAIDGDPDLEHNLAGFHWHDDPRLDEAECDLSESEPSLGAGAADADESQDGWSQVEQHLWQDREEDPAEAGLADLDGLLEQIGRAA